MAKKKIDYNDITRDLLIYVGGAENIEAFTSCQTRLRITVKSLNKVSKEKIKQLFGVLGLNISGTQVQVIFGPGKIVMARHAFEKNINISSTEPSLQEQSKINKQAQKDQNTSKLQKFVGKFSGIFAPMIIGFIGAGILAGVAGIIQSSTQHNEVWSSNTAHSWYNIFMALLSIWKGTFLIIVGWRTSEAFGGSGVMGAIIAGLYVGGYAAEANGMFVPVKGGSGKIDHFNFLGMHIGADNWLIRGFRPTGNGVTQDLIISEPSGSIFGVMISAGIVGLTEKGLRKFVPSVLDTTLTPLLTLILLFTLNLVLIFPISGYLFLGVTFLFENLYQNPFGASMLAGLFLIAVIFGVHQGFIPVYAALITATGVNGLFPILSMAGAGQVGMAIALWIRAKKGGLLRRQIQGAIIPGFLGIGEPLIYGVSLPRIKPFITASIGGAVGGFFIGAFNLWGGDPIGLNAMFGPSGLLAIPLMTTVHHIIWKAIIVYMSGLLISYGAGFLATYQFGYKGVDLA